MLSSEKNANLLERKLLSTYLIMQIFSFFIASYEAMGNLAVYRAKLFTLHKF